MEIKTIFYIVWAIIFLLVMSVLPHTLYLEKAQEKACLDIGANPIKYNTDYCIDPDGYAIPVVFKCLGAYYWQECTAIKVK